MKRINFLLTCWISCYLLISLCGCTTISDPPDYTSPEMDFSAVRVVAVLPFLNLSGEDEAADRVRDAFSGMLLATEAMYVLPPGEVARGINLANMRTPQTPSTDEILKLKTVLKVDGVITGVLREYRSVRSGSAEANLISLSLQMVETQTGTIVWSGSSTKGGITLSDRMLGSGGQPMNDVTIQVINDLLDQLFE